MQYEPLARTQLREGAAEHIKRLIVSSELPPGSAIPLAKVAEELRISMTPVREALLLLMQDGWVIQEPNRGFRVAPIRRQDVADAYLVNAFVGGELAARAATTITPEEVDELRAIDRELRTVSKTNPERVEELNYRFHAKLNRAARSRRLRWFAATTSRLDPRVYWTTIPEWIDHATKGHGPIIKAVAAGDSEAARQLMYDHVRRAGTFLLADMDRRKFWSPDDVEESPDAHDVRALDEVAVSP